MKPDYDAAARAALLKARIWYQPPHVFPADMIPPPEPPKPKVIEPPKSEKAIANALKQAEKLPPMRKRPSMMQIVNAVSQVTGRSVAEIIGPCRRRPVVMDRDVACLVGRFYGYSYPRIGRVIGNRDHSTICHTLDKVKAREIDYAVQFAATLAALEGRQ